MRAMLVGMMLAFVAALAVNAHAQVVVTQEEADRLYASLYRQSGTAVDVADGRVRIDVSSDFDFLDGADAARLFIAMGNSPELANALEGAIVPAGVNPFYIGGWAASIEFDAVGRVEEDDSALSFPEVLYGLRDRQSRWGVEVLDWVEPPYYERTNHTLYGAFELASPQGNVVNYQMYMLGRDGVLIVNIVAPMEDADLVRSAAPRLRDLFYYNEGNRYEDYLDGDLRAAQTLAGLLSGELTPPPADTAASPAEPYTADPYTLTYDIAPEPLAAPPPPPEWVTLVLWGVAGGFVALFALLAVLSLRGNEAISRESRDRLNSVRNVDIDRIVRARESLRIIRSYFGHSLLGVGGLYYVAMLIGGAGFLVYLMQTGAAPGTPSWIEPLYATGWLGQIAFAVVVITVLAILVLAFLSIFQFIHRRFTGFLQVLFVPLTIASNVLVIGTTGQPLYEALEAAFGRESWIPATASVILIFGLMAASAIMLFCVGRNFWRMTFARRDNFLVARGWRAPGWSLGNAVRRMLGVPTYVSALRSGRHRVMLLFMIAGALGAAAALFPLMAPGLFASMLPVLGRDMAGEGDYAQFAIAGLVLIPLILLAILMILLLFAFFGSLVRRGAQRMSANRYQSVREWDHRAPILYLRSFTIDNQPVKVRPRGWTARLIGLSGVFPTLDEAVLDCAAPYGPVIAIGDPRDPVPPLGAARKFVGQQGDWKKVVADLANASQLIVMVVDSTEGVRWEVKHIVDHGHAAKTLFLASPSRTPAERAASLSEVARLLSHPEPLPRDAIGVSPSKSGGIEVLKSPTTSGDAYAVVLNLRLQQDFGLKVKFPKRGGLAASAR